MFYDYNDRNRNLMVFEERDPSKAIIPGVTDRVSPSVAALGGHGRVIIIGNPADIRNVEKACNRYFNKVLFSTAPLKRFT